MDEEGKIDVDMDVITEGFPLPEVERHGDDGS